MEEDYKKMPPSKLQYRCPICGQIEGNCNHLTMKENAMNNTWESFIEIYKDILHFLPLIVILEAFYYFVKHDPNYCAHVIKTNLI